MGCSSNIAGMTHSGAFSVSHCSSAGGGRIQLRPCLAGLRQPPPPPRADPRFNNPRHEATNHLFQRATPSEAQIMKITGHKSHRMMMSYANLRGSDLAQFFN